jgi:rhamnulokinase
MNESAYIAIDMGAGSIRVILGTLSNKLSVREIHRFENNPVEIEGHLRWNLSEIEKEIAFGIKKAIQESEIPVNSISTDSWGVDFVLIGKDGMPLEFPVTYRDFRTNGMAREWEKYMPKKETFERTGINYYPFNSLFQFLSIKGSRELQAADAILFTANYINYFLSGIAVNELSLASTTQMLNAKHKDWDEKILHYLNIQHNKLNTPKKAGIVLGKLKKEFGDPNINVSLAPGHDSAGAVVAIPAESDNFAFLSTGTWCVLGTESDIPFNTDIALENGITNEVSADGKFRPLRNIMGLWLIQQLRQSIDPNLTYSEIEALCHFDDTFAHTVDTDDPGFYNPSDMVQAFDEFINKKYNITFKTPAEYFQCAYESLALSFSNNIKILEELRGKKFETIHMTGGGCQSEILCRLTAKATGLPVHAGPVEGAALGNILYQAIADKKVKNIEEARAIVKRSIPINSYLPHL